jgi:hypothetical protein
LTAPRSFTNSRLPDVEQMAIADRVRAIDAELGETDHGIGVLWSLEALPQWQGKKLLRAKSREGFDTVLQVIPVWRSPAWNKGSLPCY